MYYYKRIVIEHCEKDNSVFISRTLTHFAHPLEKLVEELLEPNGDRVKTIYIPVSYLEWASPYCFPFGYFSKVKKFGGDSHYKEEYHILLEGKVIAKTSEWLTAKNYVVKAFHARRKHKLGIGWRSEEEKHSFIQNLIKNDRAGDFVIKYTYC